jgi:hypothetical protein
MTGTIAKPTLSPVSGMIAFMHIHMNDCYETDAEVMK